jgi:hypothetical protein
VDHELERRVDALRRPLDLAAADGFAGVRKVQGLGHALRAACDALIQKLPSEQLAAWRATLGRWEQLADDQKEIEIARGMRLITGLRSAPAKPVPAKRLTANARVPAPSEDPLGARTHSLPGIGPAFAKALADKGLETVEDLLWCLPRRYDDVRDARPLAEVARMEEGQRATFSAKVASARMVFAR